MFETGNLDVQYSVLVDWEHGQFQNCIRNSAFNFFRAAGEILSWEQTANFVGGSLYTTTPYNGLACLRIVGSGAAKEGELVQPLKTVLLGKNYCLSFYYKMNSYAAGAVTVVVENKTTLAVLLSKSINADAGTWTRVNCNFVDGGTLPSDVDLDNLQLRVCGVNFVGTAYIDALCLENVLTVKTPTGYSPFETFKPVAGTLDYVEGVTEIEADTTNYVDMTSYVTAEGLSCTFSTPESGSLAINNGNVAFSNHNLGLSSKVFSATYDPNNGEFNGPNRGEGNGNVCNGRRCTIMVTAFDGSETLTKPVFTGIVEVPTDYGLERVIQMKLWGRSFLPLQKNRINFTRINHFANMLQNGGFEEFEHELETSKILKAYDWERSFGSEVVTISSVNNNTFGLYAMRLAGVGVGNGWVSVYQDIKVWATDTIATLNGKYNFSVYFAGTNSTVDASQARIRVVPLTGSITGDLSIDSSSSAAYKALKGSFSTVGDATIRIYLDIYTRTGLAYEFNFDNASVVISAESIEYGAGLSFLLRELFREVGFGDSDLALEENYRLVELFQILNQPPLKDLAELLQVDRLYFVEDEYGRLVTKSYSTISTEPVFTTLDLSRFEDDDFRYTIKPAIVKVTVESDPLVAHTTFGKRVNTGAISNQEMSQEPSYRIRIENIDEMKLNHLTVGILDATLINTDLLIAKKVQTRVSGERIDINVTTDNRLTFYDSIYAGPVLSLGTREETTGLFSVGNFHFISNPALSTANSQGIFVRTKAGIGTSLIAQSGTDINNSNAILVANGVVQTSPSTVSYNGVKLWATGVAVTGYTKTANSGDGIQFNARAIEFRAPTGDAYGTSKIVFRAYTEGSSYANFMFTSPDISSGFCVSCYEGTGTSMIGGNIGYNGALFAPAGGGGSFICFDVPQNMCWIGVHQLGGGAGNYWFKAAFTLNDVRFYDNVIIRKYGGGAFDGDGLTIEQPTGYGVKVQNAGTTSFYAFNCQRGVEVLNPTNHGIWVRKTTGAGGAVCGDSEDSDAPAIWGTNPNGVSNNSAGYFAGHVRMTRNLTVDGTITKGGGSCLTLDLYQLDDHNVTQDGMLMVLSEKPYSLVRLGNKPISKARLCCADMQKTVVGILVARGEFQTPEVETIDLFYQEAFDSYCSANNLSYSKEVYVDFFEKDHAGAYQKIGQNIDTSTHTSDYLKAFFTWYAEPENNDLFFVGILGEYGSCLVDPQFGAIEYGDLICTSGTVGHGRKVLDSEKVQAIGCIVGKALSVRSVEDGPGLIAIDIFKA